MRKKQPEFRAYKSATANGNHKWYIIGRPAGKRIRAWFATFRVRVDIQILRERNRAVSQLVFRLNINQPGPEALNQIISKRGHPPHGRSSTGMLCRAISCPNL